MIGFTYISPRSDSITFDKSPPYRLLRSIDGVVNTLGAPQFDRAPGQVGATLLEQTVGARTVTMELMVTADTTEELWQARQDLAAALWAVTTQPETEPDMGTLRIHRGDLETLETSALPQSSPGSERWLTPTVFKTQVHFYCPDPRWRETSDRIVQLEAEATGFSFPLAHPWHSLTVNIDAILSNPGTVHSPMVIRLYGEMTTSRILHTQTDEVIEITGLIEEGEHIEIDTGFRRKRVELVDSEGNREDAMHRLNLNKSDFIQLRPGNNELRLEADDNVSGRAWIAWRARYGGV